MSANANFIQADELVKANSPTGTKGLLALDKVGQAVLWFHPETFEVQHRLMVTHPHQMSISPDHEFAVVSEFGLFRDGKNVEPGRHLCVISIANREIVARIDIGSSAGPHGSRWDAGGLLWVVCEETGTLLQVDVTARRVINTLQVATPLERAHLIEILPDATTVFVACKNGPIKIVDVINVAVTGLIDVGSGTEGIACIRNGEKIVAAANARQDLVVIDVATRREEDRIPLLGAVMSSPKRSRLITLQSTPDGQHLLSSNGVGGSVQIHSTCDLRKQTLVLVAKGPQGMAVTADGSRFVVANHDAGIATVVGLSGTDFGKPLQWFEAGKGVEALAFY